MITYIKKNVPGKFLELENALEEGLYNIGTTIEDYNNGAWVALSNEQTEFRANNLNASVNEVWNMEVKTNEYKAPERTLQQAINEKRWEIERYDQSREINTFTINGIETWYDKATRVGLANSIAIEESDGRTETTLWFGDSSLVLSIDKAKELLKTIELYALECFNVTSRHKAAVSGMENIDDVDGYDFKSGYPEKLNFNV